MAASGVRVTHLIVIPYLFLRMASSRLRVVYGSCGAFPPLKFDVLTTLAGRAGSNGNESVETPLYRGTEGSLQCRKPTGESASQDGQGLEFRGLARGL